MTTNEEYEIKAEAFRIMTGHLAPGKDPSPAANSSCFDERFAAYDQWIVTNGKCANAMMLAFKYIMEESK